MSQITDPTARDWATRRVCRTDPDAWHARNTRTLDQAVEACGWCPLRVACLNRALEEEKGLPEIHGVQGGLRAKERRKLLERGRT